MFFFQEAKIRGIGKVDNLSGAESGAVDEEEVTATTSSQREFQPNETFAGLQKGLT